MKALLRKKFNISHMFPSLTCERFVKASGSLFTGQTMLNSFSEA